jgi:hypothetical protein
VRFLSAAKLCNEIGLDLATLFTSTTRIGRIATTAMDGIFLALFLVAAFVGGFASGLAGFAMGL